MPNFAIEIFKVILNSKRDLNLLEYQSKSLLQESGVAIQEFRVLEGKQDAQNLADFSESTEDRTGIRKSRLICGNVYCISFQMCQSTW